MIFYEYHWKYYVTQNEWQSIITHTNNNDNFFIKCNETWGNLFIVLKRFGVIYFSAISLFIICVSFVISMSGDNNPLHLTLMAVFVLLPFTIYYIILHIACKIPIFQSMSISIIQPCPKIWNSGNIPLKNFTFANSLCQATKRSNGRMTINRLQMTVLVKGSDHPTKFSGHVKLGTEDITFLI